MIIKTIITGWIFAGLFTCVFSADKNKLPAAEKTIMDTADHWRLGFYDQVRRFEAAEKKFKAALGTQAPENFMVGIQNSLTKVPANKYWFKGNYTTNIY
ncbi:MAG: hypothetical protein PHV59_07405 [Victivallales bacterium]|nr:hypothetical protein [Victivallales bacterium]